MGIERSQNNAKSSADIEAERAGRELELVQEHGTSMVIAITDLAGGAGWKMDGMNGNGMREWFASNISIQELEAAYKNLGVLLEAKRNQ